MDIGQGQCSFSCFSLPVSLSILVSDWIFCLPLAPLGAYVMTLGSPGLCRFTCSRGSSLVTIRPLVTIHPFLQITLHSCRCNSRGWNRDSQNVPYYREWEFQDNIKVLGPQQIEEWNAISHSRSASLGVVNEMGWHRDWRCKLKTHEHIDDTENPKSG